MKKLLSFIFCFLAFSSLVEASTKIEEVFSDIDTNYEYYNELQTLYDKGMIFPDSNGEFNPKKYLNRDEFVGILSEISCTKCISPNTSFDLVQEYSLKKSFFDIEKTNRYYYCIADAEDKGFVKGYQIGTKCEDGAVEETQAPFCPNNTIILEEALAIVLRASGILTNDEAEKIRQDIANGNITEDLASDVSSKNIDGSVYSFYPDFLKALEYELVDIDKNGNEKIYKLIQKTQDDKLRPKQPITKEDFLYIAYVAMKANSCILKENYKLGLEMQIFPKTCNEANLNSCELSNLIGNEKVFDFFGKVGLSPGDSVTNASQYSWRFYDYSNGNEILKYGKYLDDYDFENNGKYRVYLRVISDKGLVGEVYNDINIGDKSTVKDTKKVSIKADPIIGYAPLIVTFNSIVSPISNNNSYFWNFGDSSTGVGKNIIHTFKEPGVYKVILKVTDNEGYEDEASVLIYVMDLDTDGDGIIDIEDACPTIPGKAENKGCPDGDTDGDGIMDTEDACPTIPGKVENKGCPDGDTDGDGIIDIEDACPTVPGKAENKGCPDTDGDGVIDTEDACPTIPGKAENKGCPDTDGDGVIDTEDVCPTILGKIENKGCPIFDETCRSDTDCKDGYYCSSGICSPKQVVVNCEYSGGDLITGNVVCNSCPCSSAIDFSSNIRKCDVVFPAIISPDGTTIYGKGNYFKVE